MPACLLDCASGASGLTEERLDALSDQLFKAFDTDQVGGCSSHTKVQVEANDAMSNSGGMGGEGGEA